MRQPHILKHPIVGKSGETLVTEVHVRRAKGKDLRAADKSASEFDGTLVMIERLCQMPDGSDVFPGFADELDAEDIAALGELVTASLPSGQKTGGTT